MAAKLRILDAGTWREITRLHVRQAGVWRTLKTLKVMNGGVWRTVGVFADPFSVTVSPLALYSSFTRTETGLSPPETLTSDLATAVPAGGLPPYSYSWAHLSGDTFTVSHPTNAGTYFSHLFTSYGTRAGTYRITVTDSVGSTATADLQIQIDFSF